VPRRHRKGNVLRNGGLSRIRPPGSSRRSCKEIHPGFHSGTAPGRREAASATGEANPASGLSPVHFRYNPASSREPASATVGGQRGGTAVVRRNCHRLRSGRLRGGDPRRAAPDSRPPSWRSGRPSAAPRLHIGCIPPRRCCTPPTCSDGARGGEGRRHHRQGGARSHRDAQVQDRRHPTPGARGRVPDEEEQHHGAGRSGR
jgi:hypothetical protein